MLITSVNGNSSRRELLQEAMFLLSCNQAWSSNVVPGLVSRMGIPWFGQRFHKAQRVKETLHYYSSIMLDLFASLLCSKLCQHNVDNPNRNPPHQSTEQYKKLG